jgi:hypothetical protein
MLQECVCGGEGRCRVCWIGMVLRRGRRNYWNYRADVVPVATLIKVPVKICGLRNCNKSDCKQIKKNKRKA